MIKITAHMVVKNEDRFVWYAISSILKCADTFLIADTGSEDDTIKIIEEMKRIIKSESIINIDYIDIIDHETLESKSKIDGGIILALSFFVSGIRLTDNLILK